MVKEWLIDTGCGHDLVSKDGVQMLKPYFRDASEKVVFDTAGGEAPADTVVPMYVPDIGEAIEPYILDSTPNVLSVGRRCQEFGWGFYWEPWPNRPKFPCWQVLPT